MGNKKRNKLFSVLAVIEGKEQEANLLKHLKNLYLDPKQIKFTEEPIKGGNSDTLLVRAINKQSYADRVFIWIDEDLGINEETRKKLLVQWCISNEDEDDFLQYPLANLQEKYNTKNRKPILIVSQPICVESLILRIFGKTPCHQAIEKDKLKKQKKELKNSLDGFIFGISECEYYQQNLSKDILEIRRKEIKELDLLISMLIKP